MILPALCSELWFPRQVKSNLTRRASTFDQTGIICDARRYRIYFMKKKTLPNCSSLWASRLITAWLTPEMCFFIPSSHGETHTRDKGHRSLLRRTQSHTGAPSILPTPFPCLAVWVELNRALWCEWDVSLKNITHQKVCRDGVVFHAARSGSFLFFTPPPCSQCKMLKGLR